jgi:Leucine-rich repeat (LRR) protein
VTYKNLFVAVAISNPDHPFWLWLAKRSGRIAGLHLTIRQFPNQVVDLSDLEPVAGSLHSLTCEPDKDWEYGCLKGTNTLNSMSQLTALNLRSADLGSEEPWGLVATLTNLQQLSLEVSASGDPSPLSALTRLSFLSVESLVLEVVRPVPFSFSSLKPLSTLQQLEELHLGAHGWDATSLQGLAGLNNLKELGLVFTPSGGSLRSLEGITPGLVQLIIEDAPDLVSLAGIEGCTSMEKLTLSHCGVSSFQPLRGLSSLQHLDVYDCGHLASLEGLDIMSLQSLTLRYCNSLTQLRGLEHLSALVSLVVTKCGVTSLQPLSQLREGLQRLWVLECDRVQEETLELPLVQPHVDVSFEGSNVKEVVLARGWRLLVDGS